MTSPERLSAKKAPVPAPIKLPYGLLTHPFRNSIWLLVSGGISACDRTTPDASNDLSRTPVPEPAEILADRTRAEMEALGWAPVFRGPAGLEALGEGPIVGPEGIEEAVHDEREGPCGGHILTNERRAVLVIPGGTEVSPPPIAPGMSAARVERASWRMNEVLPPSETASDPSVTPQPARQRGLEIGSVSKTRRHGAPPIHIVSGVRDCTAGVLLADSELHEILDQHTWTDTCEPVAVLPAIDLDGDTAREFAVYNANFVALLRLVESPGNVQLEPLAHWTCESNTGPTP